MIELQDVCVDFKIENQQKRILDNINLKINQGEMLAIMGPSGAGKSTLLNILGAMDIPTSGKYLFEGDDVTQYNNQKLNQFRKDKVAFVFQKFELISGYTVYENVELPLRAKNVPKKERRRMIMEVLESLGIEKLKNKFPNKISGGEMQRVAIARAIVSGNNLILADEPTGSLDQKTGEDIIQILKRLNEEGKTIVVITHDPHIAGYGDRIVKLVDGKIE